MLIFYNPSKKELKQKIGRRLRYRETSMFGTEYPATGSGTVFGNNRPHITGHRREFYAKVKLIDDKIVKVS